MRTPENPSRSAPTVNVSSDRTFGLVMTAFFLLGAFWPLIHHGPIRTWMAIAGAAFLAVTLVRASLLHPLNRAWTALAVLMHPVISPIALGALFFGVVTPVAICMRWFKRDALRLRADPSASSYWVLREPAGPEPETMLNQF